MIHLKLIIMSLLWAGAFISTKAIAHQAGPFTIAFLRFGVATLILATLVYRKERDATVSLKLFIYGGLAAFTGMVCYNYFFLSGIQFIEASRGAIIISMVPIVVSIVSSIVFNEKMSLIKTFGIFFSVVGAWIVISNGNIGAMFGESLGQGEFYFVLCVLCSTLFTFISKQMLAQLSPLVTMFCISSISMVFLLIPALMEIHSTTIDKVSYSFVANLLYLAIGPTVIAKIYYYEAIKVVGATQATQYINLMPIFSVILAMIFLGEPLTVSLFMGGGLVMLGLYFTNSSMKERRWS